MNTASPQVIPATQILRTLAAHPGRWLVPAVLVSLVAAAYAVLRTPTWEATQALIVRNEAATSHEEPGKFRHADEMKTVQDTILELVKSRGVLEAALAEVGPPADRTSEAVWPSAEEIAAVRGQIRLAPPEGAEFGTTEVFYLEVKDHDAQRAVALAGAICGQLETHSQGLRDAKARSMIEELAKSVALAEADLQASTARLTETEESAGRDLTELRILEDSNSGQSVLRQTLSEVQNELRQVRLAQQSHHELLALLKAAQRDPGHLLATPNPLLESQPALRRLKDGLLDAQLRTAQLQGGMSDRHPRVMAAREAEEQVGRQLHDELAVAVRGLQVDLRLAGGREAMLQQRLDDATARLAWLASVRATYANLATETRNRAELLKKAQQNLAEAHAAQASARATSLISRIGSPETGTAPVGPGRATILLVGIAGGLLLGVGILVLTTQSQPAAQPEQPRPTVSTNGAGRSPRYEPLSHPDNLSLKQALQKLSNAQTA